MISTIIVEIFFLISYNLSEVNVMDIQEIKKELDKYKVRINDLWRSL